MTAPRWLRRLAGHLPRYRSAIIVVALVVAASGSSLLWAARQQHGYEVSIHRAHVARLRGEQAVVDKLCLTFGKLAERQPPAGDPKANPSRAYEQWQHGVLVQLGSDLGCKTPEP